MPTLSFTCLLPHSVNCQTVPYPCPALDRFLLCNLAVLARKALLMPHAERRILEDMEPSMGTHLKRGGPMEDVSFGGRAADVCPAASAQHAGDSAWVMGVCNEKRDRLLSVPAVPGLPNYGTSSPCPLLRTTMGRRKQPHGTENSGPGPSSPIPRRGACGSK